MHPTANPDRRTVLVRGAQAAGAAVLLGGAGNLLAACGGGGGDAEGSGAGGPVRGGRLIYGISADVDGFDPTNDPFPNQGYIMGFTMIEALTTIDAEGNWQPYLAESLTPNDDFTEWTITLRPGIRFHNDEPLTAEVVKGNLDAQRASPLNAPVLAWVESVEATGERDVTVAMRGPWATFPYFLSAVIGMIIPAASLQDQEAASQRPVGTGPFVLEEYAPARRLVVTRNPDYWRDGFPYLDEIEFRILPDSQTRSQTLESGGIDAMHTTNDEHIVKYQQLQADGEFQVHRSSGAAVEEYFWMLNTAVPPVDDVRVRRALAHATNRQAFVDTLRSGLTEPADSPWTKDSPWYVPNDYPGYDLERARALVREYESEHGPVRITILNGPDLSAVQNAELAQSQWREAGIDVRIEKVDQPTLINRALTGDYQAVSWLLFESPDPDGEFVWWHSSFAAPVGELAINSARIRDDELDAALVQGRSTTDEAVRKQAYATVQQRLSALVPYIWMDHLSTSSVIFTPEVHDVTEHRLPDGQPGRTENGPIHPFHQVWKEH